MHRSFLLFAVAVLAALRGEVLGAGPAEITHSIAVGGVTESSARFWIRLSGPDQVNIQVSTTPEFGSYVTGTAELTTAERNNAAIIQVSGLLPDTKYYYRGEVGGVPQSPVRSFMTFPNAGAAATFTFAFGSCQQNNGPLSSPSPPGIIYRVVAAAHPRLFLQIGDWGYPDSTDDLPNDNNIFSADFARVQASYLARFDPAYLMDTVLAMTPVDYVYDDHDFANDNCAATTSSFSVPYKPNPYGSDFVAQDIPLPAGARENSIRGYVENMPTYPLPNPSRGIYHSFRMGSAEFFMLDLRSQLSPNLAPFAKDPLFGQWNFTPAADHSILGNATAPGSGESQMAWLQNALLASTAEWKFLVSSVPFNVGLRQVIQFGLLLQNVVIDLPGFPPGTTAIGAAFEMADKWAGFRSDQDALLTFIATHNIRNVIVLSGDSHTSAIDDGTNAGLPEIMAANLDIKNSEVLPVLTTFGINIWNKGAQGVTTTEFFNTFGKVTVFGKDSLTLALVDENDLEFASYTITNPPTQVAERTATVPGMSALKQNYPNPFNPRTEIELEVAAPGRVTLKVYDLLGREIAVLLDEEKAAGAYSVSFDASRLASGVYVYRMTAGTFTAVRTLTVLR